MILLNFKVLIFLFLVYFIIDCVIGWLDVDFILYKIEIIFFLFNELFNRLICCILKIFVVSVFVLFNIIIFVLVVKL